MTRRITFLFLFGLSGILASCAGMHQIKELPISNYTVSKMNLKKGWEQQVPVIAKGTKAELALTDSSLILEIGSEGQNAVIPFRLVHNLVFYRRTLDVDILTIPFKIRPSVANFPEQLNANFSAALYLGSRKDFYYFRNVSKQNKSDVQMTGLGFGFGGFLGVGSVTMNPFVTQQKIDYEYDGFVLTAGAASIYDIKKINLGLAIGIDHLMDKNRRHWIYQNKPWFGLLFGINLN